MFNISENEISRVGNTGSESPKEVSFIPCTHFSFNVPPTDIKERNVRVLILISKLSLVPNKVMGANTSASASQEIDFENGSPENSTESEKEWIKMSATEKGPVISSEEKVILRQSWLKLQKRMDSVGGVIFLRMFETHPKTLTPFIPHINNVREMEMDEW